MSAADAEMTALRRSFRIGMVAVAAFLIAVGGIVAAFGSNADRPAGIAERWLVALSDTTRDGLEDDAIERLEEHMRPMPEGAEGALALLFGPPEPQPFFGFPALRDDHGAADDGEARFETIQVGRGVDENVRPGRLLVPVEVTPYEADPVDGYVVMDDTEDGWKVSGFGDPAFIEEVGGFADLCPDDDCPGFPIERPERAPIGFWIGALALGVLIAAGCSLAARAATPKPTTSAPAAS